MLNKKLFLLCLFVFSLSSVFAAPSGRFGKIIQKISNSPPAKVQPQCPPPPSYKLELISLFDCPDPITPDERVNKTNNLYLQYRVTGFLPPFKTKADILATVDYYSPANQKVRTLNGAFPVAFVPHDCGRDDFIRHTRILHNNDNGCITTLWSLFRQKRWPVSTWYAFGKLSFDGRNSGGSLLSSGVYPYKVNGQLRVNGKVLASHASSSGSVTIQRATNKPPKFVQVSPPNGAYANKTTLVLAGEVDQDNVRVVASINNQSILATVSGRKFTVNLPLTREGPNPLTLTATNIHNQATSLALSYNRDTVIPQVAINEPDNEETFHDLRIPFRGSFVEANLEKIVLTLNGKQWPFHHKGNTITATLTPKYFSENRLTLEVKDKAGNIGKSSVTFYHAEKSKLAILKYFDTPDPFNPDKKQKNHLFVLFKAEHLLLCHWFDKRLYISADVDYKSPSGNLTRTFHKDLPLHRIGWDCKRDAFHKLTWDIHRGDPDHFRNCWDFFQKHRVKYDKDYVFTVFTWDGKDQNNQPASAGKYDYTIRAQLKKGSVVKATAEPKTGSVTLQRSTVQPPVISNISPANNSWLKSKALTLSGDVNQDGVTVSILYNNQTIPATVSARRFTATLTLAEGANGLTIVARNSSGQEGRATVAYNVDTILPVTAISAPLANSFSNQATIAFSGSFTETNVSVIQLLLNNNPVTFTRNGSTITATLAPSQNALNTLVLKVTDLAGNFGQTTRSFTHDNQNPTLVVSSPTDNSWTKIATITLSGSVSDANATTVSLTYNGVTQSLTLSGNNFSKQLTLTAQGNNVLTLKAVDPAGNQTQKSLTVKLDSLLPVVQITTPLNNSTVTATSVPFSGVFTELNPNVIQVKLNNVVVPSTRNGSTITATLNLVLNTANTVDFTVSDLAGNLATVRHTVTQRSGNAPKITLTSPQNNSFTKNSSVQVAGTVDDPSSTMTATVNGTTTNLTLSGNNFSGTVSLPAEGANAILVKAVNQFGTTTETVSVTRDTVLPTLAISAPANQFLTNQATIAFSGTFTEINLATVLVQLNGTTVAHQVNGSAVTAQLTLSQNTSNTVVFKVTDKAGNQATQQVSGAHDAIAPTISLSTPADNSWTNQGTSVFAGSLNEAGTLTITYKGSTQPISLTNNAFTYSATLSDEGNNLFTLEATDAAGNKRTLARTVKKDTVLPAVSIAQPLDNSLTNQASIAFSGSFTETNLSAIVVKLNGVTVVHSVSGSQVTATLALTPNTQNTVLFEVTDLAGNKGSKSVRVNHDGVAPVVTISSPITNTFTNQNLIQVTGTVSETSTVVLVHNGTNIPLTLTSGAFSHTLTLATEGAQNITVKATDAATNLGQSAVSITRDVTNPVVSITKPADGLRTGSLVIPFEGSFTETNVQTIELLLNSIPVSFTQAGSLVTANLTLQADRVNLVTFKITDKAGNSAEKTSSVTQVSRVPKITLFTPTDGAWTASQTIQLTGSVDDANAVTKLHYNGVITPLPLSNGLFAQAVSLVSQGENRLYVSATNDAGTTATASVLVRLDTVKPVVQVSQPVADLVTKESSVSFTGTFTEANPNVISLTYGGTAVPFAQNGTIVTAQVTLTPDTAKDLVFSVRDQAGNQAVVTRRLTQDSTPPALTLDMPTAGTWYSQVSVRGQVAEENVIIAVEFQGQTFNPTLLNHRFTQPLNPNTQGAQSVTVKVTDQAGNTRSQIVSFNFDSILPAISLVSPTPGVRVKTSPLGFESILTEANPGSITLLLNNSPVSFTLSTNRVTANLNLLEGENTILFRVFDLAGNQAEISPKVTLDTTGPVITLAAPTDNIFTNQGTISVSGVVSEQPAVFTLNGVNLTVNPDLTFVSTFTLSEGVNTLTLSAKDDLGNETTLVRTINRDQVNPVLQIVSPAPDAVINNSTPVIRVDFSDDFSGVDLATLNATLDNQPLNFQTITANSATTEVAMALAQGTHTLHSTVKDRAGNTITVDSSFTLDTIGPSVTINTVLSPTVFSEQNITGTADNDSSVRVRFFSPTPGGPAQVTNGASLANWSFFANALSLGTNTFRVDASDFVGNVKSAYSSIFYAPAGSQMASQALNFVEGYNTITLLAEDYAGNLATVTFTVLADFTRPTIRLLQPSAGTTLTTATSTMILELNDNLSGIAPIATSVKIDGQEYTDFIFANNRMVSNLINQLSDGSHVLTIETRDLAGNIASASFSFNTDFTCPGFVSLYFFPNSPTNQSSVQISGSINDPTGLVTINGTSVPLDSSPNPGFNYSFALLSEGNHVITVSVQDPHGNHETITKTILKDSLPPLASEIIPIQGAILSEAITHVSGRFFDENLPVAIKVNGMAADIASLTFTTRLVLPPGSSTITIELSDPTGNQATIAREVFRLASQPPAITIVTPHQDELTEPFPFISFQIVSPSNTVNPSSLRVLLDNNNIANHFTVQGDAFIWRVDKSLWLGNGSHTLAVFVQDYSGNEASATRTFITNANLGSATQFIEGVILDAETENPLSGIQLTVRKTGEQTTTDPSGAFSLPCLVLGEQIIDVDGSSNPVASYPYVNVTFDFKENLVATLTRPIYLTRIEDSSRIFIDQDMLEVDGSLAQEVNLNSSRLPGLRARIPAGTKITFPDGQNSGWYLSLTPVTASKTPEPIPAEYQPVTTLMLQPGNTRLSKSVLLTHPEIGSQLPENTPFSIFGKSNFGTAWDKTGVATFTNGVIAQETANFQTYLSFYFFLPTGDSDRSEPPICEDLNNDEILGDLTADTMGIGSKVNVQEGYLSVSHDTPPYFSKGVARNLKFIYNSSLAYPAPVFSTIFYGQTNRPNDIHTVDWSLTNLVSLSGNPLPPRTVRQKFNSVTNSSSVQQVQIALPDVKTGLYPAEVTAWTTVAGCQAVSRKYKTNVLVTNGKNSCFGTGWSLAGFDSIIPTTDNSQLLLNKGDGSTIRFTALNRPALADNPTQNIDNIFVTRGAWKPWGAEKYSEYLNRVGGRTPVRVNQNNVSGILLSDAGNGRLKIRVDPKNLKDCRCGIEIHYRMGTRYYQKDQATVLAQFSDISIPLSERQDSPKIWSDTVKFPNPGGLPGHPRPPNSSFFFTDFQTAEYGSIETSLLFNGNDNLFGWTSNQPLMTWVENRYEKANYGYNLGAAVNDFIYALGGDIPNTGWGYPGWIRNQPGWGFYEDNNFWYLRSVTKPLLTYYERVSPDFKQEWFNHYLFNQWDLWSPVYVIQGKDGTAYSSVVLRLDIAAFGMHSPISITVDGLQSYSSIPDPLIQSNAYKDKFVAGPGLEVDLYRKPSSYTGDDFYYVKDKNDNVWKFNQDGKITSFSDWKDNKTEYRYLNGLLRQIVDPVGKAFTFVYSGERLHYVTDPAQRHTVFNHDSNGNVVSIDLSSDAVPAEKYAYSTEAGKDGLLVSRTDGNGNVTQYDYGFHRRLLKITLPGGGRIRTLVPGKIGAFEPPSPGNNNSIAIPSGSPDFLSTILYANQTRQQFKHNRYGANTELIDGLNKSTRYVRTPRNYLQKITDPAGVEAYFQYAPNGNLISSRILTASSTYEYQGIFNQISKIKSPMGNETLFSYSQNGDLSSINVPGLFTRSFQYTSGNRLVTGVLCGATQLVNYFYNSDGNLSQIKIPGKTPINLFYNSAGLVNKVIDPRNHQTDFFYDPRNRLILTINHLGMETHFQWDGNDNLLSITVDKNGLALKRSYHYDEGDRLVKFTDELNNIWEYQWDKENNLTEILDPEGRKTTYQYNANNDLVLTREDPGGLALETKYQYMVNRKLAMVTASNQNTTEYLYDNANRLWKICQDGRFHNGTGRITEYRYDLNHNLENIGRPSGNIAFYYDRLNRLVRKSWPGTTVNYQFDGIGNLNFTGNTLATYRYSYTPAQELARQDFALKPESNSLPTIETTSIFEYDANSNPTGLTIRDPRSSLGWEHKLQMVYNELDLLSEIQGTHIPGSKQRVGFSYDRANRRSDLSMGNVLNTHYQYDRASRLTEILVQQASGYYPALPGVLNSSYPSYDRVGNIKSIVDIDGSHLLNYDGVYRLTSATHPAPYPTETFHHDASGNIVGTMEGTFAYNLGNQIQNGPGLTFTHDPNGNISRKVNATNQETWDFTWDATSLLKDVVYTKIPTNPVKCRYFYDPFGRKVRKEVYNPAGATVPTDSESFVYQGNNVAIILNHQGKARAKYTHGPGLDAPLLLEVDRDQDGTFEKKFWLSQNHQGTVVALFDEQGNLVQRHTYDSYGNLKAIKNAAGQEIPDQCPEQIFGFQGREYDKDTGLMYFRSRWYDPSIRRFISEDPVWSTNLYTAFGNNPVNFVDPDGRFLKEAGEFIVKRGSPIVIGLSLVSLLATKYFDYAAKVAEKDPSIPKREMEAKQFDLLNAKDEFKRNLAKGMYKTPQERYAAEINIENIETEYWNAKSEYESKKREQEKEEKQNSEIPDVTPSIPGEEENESEN